MVSPQQYQNRTQNRGDDSPGGFVVLNLQGRENDKLEAGQKDEDPPEIFYPPRVQQDCPRGRAEDDDGHGDAPALPILKKNVPTPECHADLQ